MSIQEVLDVVAAPEQPLETGSTAAWRAAQEDLGARFPKEWREFGNHYGTGRFVDPGRLHIEIWNPFSAVFSSRMRESLRIMREFRQDEGESAVPYDVFPGEPGLLPLGSDDNGNQLFWLTEGKVDRWPIILLQHEWGSAEDFERIDLTMTSFLAKAFQREIETSIWPEPFLTGPDPVWFEPLHYEPAEIPETKTIHQLYVDNGNQAGFWVRNPTNDPELRMFVRSVNGQTEGPFSGEPPLYEGGKFIFDYYYKGDVLESAKEDWDGRGYVATTPPTELSS